MAFVILVATDFSDASERAVARALELAWRAEARLVIAHVIPPWPLGDRPLDDLREDEASMLLDRVREEAANNGVAAVVELRHGAVVPQLLDASEASGANLIVVGTRGRGFIKHALFGSVSKAICEESRAPVMLVGDPSRPEAQTETGL